jgi:hypothetical protein
LSDADISRLERDVEAARAKLVADLSRLRSPAALDDFTKSARDTVLDQVKTRTRSAWESVVDDLKAKAAENPAATLAIGAGLAWRVFRHPPIATALVGAGLFSLLRSSSARVSGSENADYVSHAKQRLRQQATHLGGGLMDRASDIGTELKTEADAMTDAIKEKSAQLADAATDKMQEWAANVGEAVRDAPEQAASLARKAERSTRLLQDPDIRDNLLLGIAGVAVIAALGTAYKRRNADFETF